MPQAYIYIYIIHNMKLAEIIIYNMKLAEKT